MKKLLAVLVVFALIMGTAFAEVSIGGGVGLGAKLLQGDNSEKGDDDPVIYTGLGTHWISTNFVWQANEGNAGGKIKINGDQGLPTDAKFNGRIWWKPLDVLKIDFFLMEDEGVFGRGNAIAWGYQSNSASDNVTNLWGAGWNSFSNATLRSGIGFFGGTGNGTALALSLFPMDGLAVNYSIPLGDDANTADVFKKSIVQVTYDISGIGNFAISFGGYQDYAGLVGWAYGIRAQTLAFDFSLSALEGMNIEIGAKIPVGGKKSWGVGKDYDDADDVSLPIEIGLGFALNQWASDPLKLFARAGVLLPTEDCGDITAFGLDINPSYDLGIFRVYFDFGVALAMQKDNDDTDFFWHFNPYLKKSLGIGDLYFGINLWNGEGRSGYEGLPSIMGKGDNGLGTNRFNFAIPILFEISF